jgi:hypothetical protein
MGALRFFDLDQIVVIGVSQGDAGSISLVIGRNRTSFPATEKLGAASNFRLSSNEIFTARLSIHRMDIEEAIGLLLLGTLVVAFIVVAAVIVV